MPGTIAGRAPVAAASDVLSPTPSEEPLTVPVACDGVAGGHEVTIGPDWSLKVPHDLEAERVARAFGGASSCLELAERVLPVAREWLALQSRATVPWLNSARGWEPVPVANCCLRLRSEDGGLDAAAEHARSTEHLAAAAGVRQSALQAVTDALALSWKRVWDDPDPEALAAAERCVQPGIGALRLWRLGLSFELICTTHAALSWEKLPLPFDFYTRLLSHRPGRSWIRQRLQALQKRPGHELLAWVLEAERTGDHRLSPDRAVWLATGLPQPMIFALSEAGYGVEDPRLLAERTGYPFWHAAGVLTGWVAAGCRPTVEQLLALYGLGLPVMEQHLPGEALVLLETLVSGDGVRVPRTRLGLLLAVVGSARMAHAWVRAGVTDPFAVARRITDGLSPAPVPEGVA